MAKKFKALALTLFPEMFPGPLGISLAGKALDKEIWSLDAINIRDFAQDKHFTVDASSYGGGTGMVMKPDILDTAIVHAKQMLPAAKLIYFSPRGIPMNQSLIHEFISQDLILLCGRFEGVDQRVIEHHDILEVSLGDFILSGGEIAALALLDACVRLLPGVIGNADALIEESFSSTSKYAGLLEYPHYTRPSVWNNRQVPDILLSGNHEQISAWRLEQAKNVTKARRPELWEKFMNTQGKD